MKKFAGGKDTTLLLLMLGTISKEDVMAQKQKSDIYNVIFDVRSGKFIPVKNAEKSENLGKTESGATVKKAYLINGIEAKVLERQLNTAQNNMFQKSLVGKITTLVELLRGSV